MTELTMDLWDAPKEEINKLFKELNLMHVCACPHGLECKRTQVIFALNGKSGNVDLRGRRCFGLNLSGDNEKKKKWKKLVLSNLGLPEDGSSVRNLQSVRVAPHHWTYGQLEYFEQSKGPSTALLSRAETNRLAHFTDENALVTDGKGNRVFLQIPNYPKDRWLEDGKSLLGSRNSRVQQRTDAVEKAEQREKASKRKKEIADEKEQKRRKQELDNMKKPWEWRAEVTDLEMNVKSANAAIEAKDIEVANLEKKLKETTKTLTNTKRKLTRAKKRKAEHSPDSADSADADAVDDVVVISVTDILNLVGKLINKWGGVSRLSLLNEAWHSQHDDAANILFGFQTWNEVIGYIESLFPDVNTNLKGKIAHYKGSGVVIMPTELTPFERCLACKMFFHSMPHRGKVAAAFGVSDSTMGRVIQDWGPRWGKGGEQLSVLIITPQYLLKENPDDYIALGYHHGAALKDGKDFASQYKRSDSALQRFQQSPKIKSAAGRCLTWATGAGLSFENTAMFGARLSEKSLNRLWGSLGKAKAPLEEWKNYAHSISNKAAYFKLRLKSALDDVDYAIVIDSNDSDNKGDDGDNKGDGDSDYEESNDSDDTFSDDDISVESETNDCAADGDGDGDSDSDNDNDGDDDDDDDGDAIIDDDDSIDDTDSIEVHVSRGATTSGGGAEGTVSAQRQLPALVSGETSPGVRRRIRQIRKNKKRRQQRRKRGGQSSLSSVQSHLFRTQETTSSKSDGPGSVVDSDESGSDEEGSVLRYVTQDFELRLRAQLKLKDAAQQGEKRKKSVFIDDKQALIDEAMETLKSSPQSSAIELLCQLETHERLHRRYESKDKTKKLRKCMLSYYLKIMESDRMRILHHLGSDMVPDDYAPGDEPLPDVWLRLAKIPASVPVIADKGFEQTDRFYPWWNLVWTPIVMRDRNIKQCLLEEMVGKRGHRGLKRVRYTIETGYSRVTDLDCLKDVIPYANLSMIQSMLAWGHAQINIGMPFRRPGWSPPGYWDDSQ